MPNYLTVAEYRAAPTAASTQSLVAAGDQATQDAALLELIAEASALFDSEATQSLISTSSVEWVRCRVQADGTLSLHLRRNPPNQLLALSVGTTGSDLVALSNLAGVFLQDRQWVVPFSPLSMFAGSQVLAKVTAVAGWPNTTIPGTTLAAATSITVTSGVGFTPAVGSEIEEPVTIYDGKFTEVVTVTAAVGNVLTLAAPGLVNPHGAGVAISMLPADVKRGVVFGVNWLLKSRQGDALVTNTVQTPGAPVGDRGGFDLTNMKRIAQNYARVR